MIKKIGVVGIKGAWSSERLADEIERLTNFRCLIDLSTAEFDLNQQTVFCQEVDLQNLDGIVVKKLGIQYSPDLLNRLSLLSFLENKGLRIFSASEAIRRILNRLDCTRVLAESEIPIPPTVVTEDMTVAIKAVKRFKKAILKPLFTSKARGMRVVHDGEDLEFKIKEFQNEGNTMIYIQKYLSLPGKDLGITFLGGQYIGTYARAASQDAWCTTTANGGRYQTYSPSDKVIDLAYRAQLAMGLDFTCVDLAQTDEGVFVFEVSAFGGFRGLWEASQINVAQRYAQYMIEELSCVAKT